MKMMEDEAWLGVVRVFHTAEGGNVVNSFDRECWKADISYEAVLRRGVAKMDWELSC